MGETGGGGSFSVRSPPGGAFLYALVSKFYNEDKYDDIIEKNVAYLLGDNNNHKSYVVGFTRNNASAPKSPHHRGYYANEDPGREVDSGLQPPEKNKLLGGLIAGDFNSGSHSGTVSNWQVNEVCVDMNAPLVGALGYILSKKAPVIMENEKEEEEEVEPPDTSDVVPSVVKIPGLKLFQSGSEITLTDGSGNAFDVQVFDLNGKMVKGFKGARKELSFTLESKGVYQVRVTARNARRTFVVKSL
jgi:hypothetical protein